jgi:hypothetical protein
VRDSFCDKTFATRELVDGGVRGLVNGKQRRSYQATMRKAITWEEFGKTLDQDAVRRLEAAYKNITVPCLIVWGDCDETLPLSMGYKLKDQIPNARLAIVPDCKHLLPLEKPTVCAQLCRSFDRDLRPPTAGSLAADTLARFVSHLSGGSTSRFPAGSVTLVQDESANKNPKLAMKP